MSLVDNTPTPCTLPAGPPAGAALVTLRWYINWPIIYDLGPAPAAGLDIYVNQVHNNGGKIVGVYFYDSAGKPIPGLDACGNPLPPPGGGGGGGSGPPPPPDPGNDDLTNDFGELFIELKILIDEIAKLTTSQPQPIDYTHCCHAIVVAIETLAKVVAKIELVLANQPTQGVPPIDLLPVQAELKCICDALAAANSPDAPTPTEIRVGAKSIADAITNAPPTDLKPVVDAINAFAKIVDVKQPVIDYLLKAGFVDGDLAQAAQTADFGDWIVGAFRTYGFDALKWFMHTAGWEWNGSTFVAVSTGPTLSTLVEKFLNGITGFTSFSFEQLVKDAIARLVGELTPTRIVPLGEEAINPDSFLLLGFSALLDTWLANFFIHLADVIPGQGGQQLIHALTRVLGFDELRQVQLGPLIRYGPARVAEMRAKFLNRQELPGINTLAMLRGRGLLDDADYQGLEGLTGVPPQLAVPIKDAAQHGIPVFQLARYANTGLFTNAELADEFTFAGMRAVSQHRYMAAAAYIASQPERLKFRGALQTFYVNGMISDNDLVSRLESAEHNTDRTNLVLETVQLEKQIALAKEYEGAYSREFLAGLSDPPGYQAALEALGMQPPDVAARMFRDETHLNVTTSIQAARQARALQRAEAAAERKTAIEAYRTGNSDPAALSAALLATGLTPVQVAATTTFQVLQSAGVLRWIFGLKLPPSQATLLRQQVADLTRQREIELLTDTQYVSALQALKIPAVYIQAMRAGANAHISPKTKAILTPPVAP